MRNRSSFVVVAALMLLQSVGLAQRKADVDTYPSRPVRIIVPNTAGSAMDVVTAHILAALTEIWGHQVVVDNRAGASGIIGNEIAAKSRPTATTCCSVRRPVSSPSR